jgi:hypothetical protein
MQEYLIVFRKPEWLNRIIDSDKNEDALNGAAGNKKARNSAYCIKVLGIPPTNK